MPFEPTYGFPFESPNDLPGWSLTGGPDGEEPILAERVAAQLRRLDDRLQALTDEFGSYPDLMQAGSVLVAPSTLIGTGFYNDSYYRGQEPVVFDTPFTGVIPAVFVCTDSTVPGVLIECSASDVTLEGFNANTARQNTTASTVWWIASQQTQLG